MAIPDPVAAAALTNGFASSAAPTREIERRHRKKKKKKNRHSATDSSAADDTDSATDDNETSDPHPEVSVEIEYVPEKVDITDNCAEMKRVFEKFSFHAAAAEAAEERRRRRGAIWTRMRSRWRIRSAGLELRNVYIGFYRVLHRHKT